MRLKVAGLLMLMFCCSSGFSQLCTTLGQTPQTALPVCGEQTFQQSTVPFCGNYPIPVPGCGNDYGDANPFWYKFSCFKSGTLSFLITPDRYNEDYDWQIFDVTGHDVSDVYTNAQLFVSGNWSGTVGETGAAHWGNGNVQCGSQASETVPTFNAMAGLIEGHQYLLMVSHFTRAPNGYTLTFNGGTATITDTLQPALKNATINCDATAISVKLNKKLKCSSLATDGSDFRINNDTAAVLSAQGIGCSTGFDLDSLMLNLNKPLQPGKYTLFVQQGRDTNTMLDYCDKRVPVQDSVVFEVFSQQPVIFDSIAPPGCAPGVIQLIFRKGIRCNSIAADGSDFTINSTIPVTVTGAAGSCVNGLSKVINIQLSRPLQEAGTFQVNITKGVDGNTIIDECGNETIVSSRSFITSDTVSASFDHKILYGCKTDTIICFNKGGNGITNWSWTFTGGHISQAQNATVAYNSFGAKQIMLRVTNGTCSDSSIATVNLDNELKAAFNISLPIVCPQDKVTFTDASSGRITSWSWDFNNGLASTLQSPQLAFPPVAQDQDQNVRLVVRNDHNCFDTAYQWVKVLSNCYISVPSAFTPNGDSRNDYLYVLNAYKAADLHFKIFNRYGQLVFATTDPAKKWDGTVNGSPQPSGTYVWTLNYTHLDTGKSSFLKGAFTLLR